MSKKPCVAIDSIMDMAVYTQGTSTIKGVDKVIKLSSNENPFGASPKVLQAIKQSSTEIHRYADGGCQKLRKVIAKHHNIKAELIVCGAGSDELIALLCQAYAGIDDEIIYTEYGFLMYPISAMRVGAKPVIAKETDLKIDVQNIVKKITNKTKIIFIANPSNPTGNYITQSEIITLLEKIPSDVILVIDSAYAEFVTANDYSSGIELVEKYDNLVMFRTFSKIYGLGGLRLGWSYAPPEITDVLHRVRGPFNVSNIAMSAGIAAIEDHEYTAKYIEHNTKWLKIISDELKKMGLKTYPSVANFVLVEFPDHDKNLDNPSAEMINAAVGGGNDLNSTTELNSNSKTSSAADAYLKSKGIIGRMMVAYGLPDCMRFTIGKEEENLALLEALKEFMNN